MKEYEITMVKCPECGKYTRIQKYEVKKQDSEEQNT